MTIRGGEGSGNHRDRHPGPDNGIRDEVGYFPGNSIHVHLVINRVRSENDVQKVRDHPGDHANLFSEQFVIQHEERMLECAPDTELLLNEDTPFTESIRKIRAALKLYGVRE